MLTQAFVYRTTGKVYVCSGEAGQGRWVDRVAELPQVQIKNVLI